jgi:hypothetical protein
VGTSVSVQAGLVPSETAVRHVPGGHLLRPAPFAAAALIAFNDGYLKRHHPGTLSGKLSDVGLCFFFPLFVVAVVEWAAWLALDLPRARPFRLRAGLQHAGVALGALYFVGIKLFPAGARAHVALLTALFPGRHFRAVADWTDLVCLPLVGVAAWYLARRRRFTRA